MFKLTRRQSINSWGDWNLREKKCTDLYISTPVAMPDQE
jgi:hypothetical protein